MAYQDYDSVRIFFSLLRAGMYGTPVPEDELPASIDWNAVTGLARKHVVSGIVIEGVRLLPDRLRPAGRISERMGSFALRLIQANMVMDKTAASLASFLKRHGVDGVLLKGQGVARYYRIPQMRQSGDIDYYVGRKHYKKASALCRESAERDSGPCEESAQHLGFKMNGITIELHRRASRMFSPFSNRRFQKWTEEELEHSPARRMLTLGGEKVRLPSYDFDAVYIFYHAWRHFISGGIGLRQLCDWAMIFHSHGSDIDREKLEETVRRLGLTRGWALFASIAVRHLGVPEEQIPLYDRAYDEKSESILADIVAGGNFGYYSHTFRKAMSRKSFLGRGLGKVRAATRYFMSLFPIIPAEATFLYINRLIYGTLDFSKRFLRKH